MMKKSLIIFIICHLYLLLTACVAQHPNPDIKCPSDSIVEHEQGEPFPIRYYPDEPIENEIKTVAELNAFCNRLKKRFSQSDMTVPEAKTVYAILQNNQGKRFDDFKLTFGINCSGVPNCERKPYDIPQQVMLKKINSEEIELFFAHTPCGLHYVHLKLYLEEEQITELIRLEHWVEFSLCRMNLSEGG